MMLVPDEPTRRRHPVRERRGRAWRGRLPVLLAAAALLPVVAACAAEPGATPTPDDRLVVVTATPGPERRPTTPPPVEATYVVQEGDTLSGVAARFGVSEEAILRANRLDDPNRVMVGQELVIPPPEP